MNKEQLKELLENTLLNQKLDLSKYCNSNGWAITRKLREVLDEEITDNLSFKYDNRIFCFCYKGYSLFGFQVKTHREYTHERYSSTYYSYIIDSIRLFDWSFDDLGERIIEINKNIVNNKSNQQKEFSEMLDCYIKIKEMFGDKTDSVLRYIERHKYSLDKGEL